MAVRNLTFRGDDKIIGSEKNGNFLGIVELISKFNSFLQKHIEKHVNKESGHVNYLYSPIYEEVILPMGNEVLKEIIRRMKIAK